MLTILLCTLIGFLVGHALIGLLVGLALIAVGAWSNRAW